VVSRPIGMHAGSNGYPSPESGADGLADFVATLVRRAGLADRLSECGVEHNRLEEMATEAARQWTGGFKSTQGRRGGTAFALRSGILDCSLRHPKFD